MKRYRMVPVLALAAMAAACGGGGDEGAANGADTTGTSAMPAETGPNPNGTGTMTPPTTGMDSASAPGMGPGMTDSATMGTGTTGAGGTGTGGTGTGGTGTGGTGAPPSTTP